MGYHIILELTCKLLLPHMMTPAYFDLCDIWLRLGFDKYTFDAFKVEGDIFSCRLEKKPHLHPRNLEQDYLIFVKEVIVPISSVITECKISHDDYDFLDVSYTDEELRSDLFVFSCAKSSKSYRES